MPDLLDKTRSISALAVGHVTHDRYGRRIRCGGSAWYAARALKALGARAGIATVVGRDFACETDLAGIDVRMGRCSKTTTFRNLYSTPPLPLAPPPHSCRRMSVASIAGPVRPELIAPKDRRPDILFLCPVIGELDAQAWIRKVDARIVGLGLQGFLKQPGPGIWTRARPVIPKPFAPDLALLSGVHAVFLSHEDLDGHPKGLLDALVRAVPLVFLTLGDQGSLVLASGRVTRIGVFPTRALDPTGAGDTYAAACLVGLALGLDPVESAILGSAAASLVVEGVTGTCNVTRSDMLLRARRIPRVES